MTTFVPFSKQDDFLHNLLVEKSSRAIGAFAGKRGGKTEVGAVGTGALIQEKFAWDSGSIDPYVAVISAPTYAMLERLSWKKFVNYWKPFLSKKYKPTKSPMVMYWHDHDPERTIKDDDKIKSKETIIYGISADSPERIEGIKASVIWIDEVFQVSEQFFLECLARTADCGGVVICTGSLGVQFVNPKEHWAYKYFKKSQFDGFMCIEWPSSENPHFNEKEIARLKDILDEQTFNAMFTITWDLIPKSAVYHNWSEANEITNYKYNENFETYVSWDWGWTHPMSLGIYQYDRENDFVYKFDEIFGSKKTIDQFYNELTQRPYIKTITKTRIDLDPNGKEVVVEYPYITNVKDFVCDIAGDQERELVGSSNIKQLKKKYGIKFKRRKSSILKGISIVRSYIKTVSGRVRFFVDVEKCPETVSGIKRYSFPEKDGIIQSENPIKENDDAVDETRYFFWNVLDKEKTKRRQSTSGSI